MSEFINTIDELGDEVAFGKLIERNLTEIKDNKLSNVKKYLFYKANKLTSVDFPNAATIGGRAFQYCTNLTTVNLPNATSIGEQTFDNCTNLTTVNIPNATSISRAFTYCKSLIMIELPSITKLAGTNFYECKKLARVDFSSIVTIGSYSIYNTALDVLILRSNEICSLENVNAFSGTPIASGSGYIYVPRALIDTYKSATNWSTYAAQFRVLEDYTVDGTTTGEFVVPTMTRALNNKNITSVTNDDIRIVGNSSFFRCNQLTYADFPNCTKIETYAFMYCENLTTLILRNTENVVVLENSDALSYTPFRSGAGWIYVPRALIVSYREATNWGTYFTYFRVLEDYTVDGTTTGALDESKIGGEV